MSFGSRSIRSGRMPGAGTSPTVPSARPTGRFLGSAGGASNRHSRIGEGCSSLCACGPKVGSWPKCEELNVRKSGPPYSTSKNPRDCTGEPLRNAGIGAGALSRRQSRQTTHLPLPRRKPADPSWTSVVGPSLSVHSGLWQAVRLADYGFTA